MAVKGKGRSYAWLAAHVAYQGSDCLQWPFSRDGRVGRGRLGHEGKMWWAHRLMCLLANGEPPTPQHQAAHNCGKGHYGCVNPRHLEWKTNSANQIDRRKNGNMLRNRRGVRGNLSKAQQQEIVALKGQMTQVAIAAKFGVSLGCVQYWHKWRKHRGVGGKIRVYTPEEDAAVITLRRSGASWDAIAQEVGFPVEKVKDRYYRASRKAA